MKAIPILKMSAEDHTALHERVYAALIQCDEGQGMSSNVALAAIEQAVVVLTALGATEEWFTTFITELLKEFPPEAVQELAVVTVSTPGAKEPLLVMGKPATE